jgi:hypothetical protein
MEKLAAARGLEIDSDHPRRFVKQRYEHLRGIMREY